MPGNDDKKKNTPMTFSTLLSIAAARDGLKAKRFSALELTDAYLAAMEKARVLNAYIVETPDKARGMAKASDERLVKGEAGALGRSWHQGPVCHRRHPHPGVQPCARRVQTQL